MYSVLPLSASCPNALAAAAIKNAAAHRPADIDLPIGLMSRRFGSKDLQLPVELLPVFDSNQENRARHTLNGAYEHE
jgi:hypothetical protein